MADDTNWQRAGKLRNEEVTEAEEPKVHHEALDQMRRLGGTWASYINSDLSSVGCGHRKFMKVGPGCTFESPPQRHPDTPTEINWRYLYEGMVNLETGDIVKETKR